MSSSYNAKGDNGSILSNQSDKDEFPKGKRLNELSCRWAIQKAYFVLKVKFSGKDPGKAHQIPSVSNSSGRPIFSTSKRAFWIIFAPVYVTTPAISIEYHLAPLE